MRKDEPDRYNARLTLYVSMAHYVAKTLHMRPNDILDTWGVPELIVAFGEYANEQAHQNYTDWKALDSKSRASIRKPNEYIVYFHNDIEEQTDRE